MVMTHNRAMTIIQAIADEIESAARFLAHFLGTTRPDKLNWAPQAVGEESKTRTALQIVAECSYVNRRTRGALAGEPYEGELPVYETAEQAQADLISSAVECAAEVRKHDESVLTKMFVMPFGEVPGSMLLGVTKANMHYHNGQINMIQCLYGDDVFHFPKL